MEVNLARSLGPIEAKVMLTLLEHERQIVTVRDVTRILRDERQARKAIDALIRKGWLIRLRNGRYLTVPADRGPENYGENNALATASAAVDPSYIGWWSAAAFHGFTTQRPTTVTVATTRDVPRTVIEGTPIQFVRLSFHKFFGFESYTIYGRETRISDPEKTVIDCIDKMRLCGGPAEVVRIAFGAMRTVEPEKLARTGEHMDSVSLLQRLGFIADLIGLEFPAHIRADLRKGIPRTARSVFGERARRDDEIGYVSEWGLFVHESRRTLLADVPVVGSSQC